MSKHNRVMWSEGMFLQPQHFQYQDEFHHHQLGEASVRSGPFSWGVQVLEIDLDALAHGRLKLSRLKMVFADGTLFDAPQHDPLPPVRDLGELTGVAECKVFAALRQLTPFSPNVVDDEHRRGQDRRFRQRFESLPDLLEGELENELALLELNVTLLLEDDGLDGTSHCPLLRLKRNAAGEFSVDPAFIPPSLHLSASPALLTLGQRLIGVLQAKNEALSSRRRERADKVAEFGSSDVTLFWLLYTVNRAYPHLAHLLAHPRLPPVELFRFLSDLVASLMTFSTQHGLAELPDYDHLDAAASLTLLETRARELLDTVVPNQYIPIALEQTKPSYFVGRLKDPRLADADFYVCVHADMPGAKLIELVPRAFKVGSPEDIEVVVNSAMPGGTLAHAARLPVAIPVRLDNHYFALEPKGRMYDRMMSAQAIAFYVPSGFTNLKIELMAVLK
ncbi:type VI secretion system baseplate subunit TssK [Halomonas sp. DP8Y7-3]|uniref:type VI secretion system baseplate subunit TssK n=1 Tax=Halomonas sp. DP8Y7-3 TaxID=2859079 RepID=UPI001C94BCEE|nr:type VI secretion system baseplate subunit TssK [Halomonas sp. DP8Y7-3]MBY5929704.1 type VI secretion system baseplate subunit TssK [Halomonas sp. DP8Y7-3]MED5297235.1 type VI secretion system baseplate subunit TssK [Pseudomonadota bacterium]